MAINQNPQYLPASGYRPVEWISSTFSDIVAAGPVTIATATVTLDGVVIGTIKKRPFEVLGAGPVFTYGLNGMFNHCFNVKKHLKHNLKH